MPAPFRKSTPPKPVRAAKPAPAPAVVEDPAIPDVLAEDSAGDSSVGRPVVDIVSTTHSDSGVLVVFPDGTVRQMTDDEYRELVG